MPRKPARSANDAALNIHLLDMGGEKYGECLLVELSGRTILIDGGHPGDWRRRGETPSIPEQLEKLLGRPPPFSFNLLVVSHCHSDHIGCLPTLIANNDLKVDFALVADEKLGFGRAADAVAPDALSPANRLAAALREEDHSDLSDEDLAAFVEDVATLEQRYGAMLAQLEERGARIVRYGRDDHSLIEREFADFGLKVLGPSQQQLVICAEAIADSNDSALEHVGHLADADSDQIVSIYRGIVAQSDELPGAQDRPGKGAALNDQSIVLSLSAGRATALLAADMQFAEPEISGLDPLMTALRQTVKDAGPYTFIKLTHHTSYNGLNESVLGEWSATKSFAHSGGLNDAGHPDPGVLQLLEQHASEIQWARTDRNGLIDATLTGAGTRLGIEKGALNDPTPNGDAAPAPEPRSLAIEPSPSAPEPGPGRGAPTGGVTIASSRTSGGVTEVSASAKLAPDVSRLTVTFDVERRPERVESTQPLAGTRERRADLPPPPPAGLPQPAPGPQPRGVRLAPGRKLPDLLFVTNSAKLANNLGVQECQTALRAIRDAGKTVYDVRNPADPFAEIRGQLSRPYDGVVILGGYDVLPAQRLDVLPPSLRQQLGAQTGDEDNFIVWNDEGYGDRDGDGIAELPVSRIPDARSPRLVAAALGAGLATAASRFGVRNSARPFATGPYALVPGAQQLLVSAPTAPANIGAAGASAPHVYVMLHGSDMDASRFWGENQYGTYEAINVSNVPQAMSGVVFAGCCWGALTVETRANITRPDQQPAARTPASSMALSWLHAGARAFVGCTGTHYSPTVAPYDYFGGPMHVAFWRRLIRGETPAKALFGAKLDYIRGMPHGQTSHNGQAIEYKTLRQFTCLGVGW
ncbi:MAG: MBL fold metallo-hydrolase [Roseiarcus sp.]